MWLKMLCVVHFDFNNWFMSVVLNLVP